MNASTWTITMPVISTGHAPSLKALNDLESMHAQYEHGTFVFIGCASSAEENDLPDWLQPIAAWAWETYGGDCCWVRLDSAGDVIDGLPTWDW